MTVEREHRIDPMLAFRTITLRGTIHELDEGGNYCTQCGEMAEYLIDSGGVAEF